MIDHYGQPNPLDLIVRNGTLVIPGVGEMKADVGIDDGKIVVLGANLAQSAAEVYDATGCCDSDFELRAATWWIITNVPNPST